MAEQGTQPSALSVDPDSAPPTNGSAGVIVYGSAGVCLLYGVQDIRYIRVLIPNTVNAIGCDWALFARLWAVEFWANNTVRGRSPDHPVLTRLRPRTDRADLSTRPVRRAITVDWQDNAIDTSQLWQSPGSADFVCGLWYGSSRLCQCNRRSGCWLLSPDQRRPSSTYPNSPRTSSTMIAPSLSARGRVLGPLTADAVLGMKEDEVVQGSPGSRSKRSYDGRA